MFDVTDNMVRAWRQMNDPLATAEDIAVVESALGVPLPREYVEFVTQQGFVLFGRDEPERRCLFSYAMEENGQRVVRQREIRYLFPADQLITRFHYMTTAEDPDDETRPMIPPGFLAVGSDAGHSAVLLDIASHPGQVWFWPESPDRWGLGDNRALGFVADNFEDFINSLRPHPL